MFDLTGKVAVVTGASSGLGVQFAKALAAQGADIVVTARRHDKLQAVKADIEAMGKKCLAVDCDVTNEDSIAGMVKTVVEAWGKIDILVNNAGVSALGAVQDMSESDWDKVLDTNLKGVFLVTKHVTPHMIAKSYGRIINISSIFGVVANSAFTVSNYHASKFGVIGFTKAVAGELAKYGITSNAIGPGFFESEMTEASWNDPGFQTYIKTYCPFGRPGKAGELNGALLYLASDEASYTTGQVLCVDGGWTAI